MKWSKEDLVRLWMISLDLLRDDFFTVALCMLWYEAERFEEVLACYWARKVYYKGNDTAGNHLARIVRTLIGFCTPTRR